MDRDFVTESEQRLLEQISLRKQSLQMTPEGRAHRVEQASTGWHAGKLMYKHLRVLGMNHIFEVGCCAGIGAAYMCAGAEAGLARSGQEQVYYTGLELIPEKIQWTKETLTQFCPRTEVNIVEGDFRDTFEQAVADAAPLEFVYIDGRHHRDPTIHMFNTCVDAMWDGGIIMVDDLNWSKHGMREAGRVIRKHPRVITARKVINKVQFMICGEDAAG